MALFDTGRLCLKIAGRDAGKRCVVVEVLDHAYVLVDGETRRKKVNTKHLEPLAEMIEIDSGASHEEIKAAFKKLGLEIKDAKAKSATPKQLKQKAKKSAPAVEKKKVSGKEKSKKKAEEKKE